MTIKKIYSWLHLWLGLAVGLIFSIVAFTGVLMIFEKELDPMIYPGLYHCSAPVQGQPRQPLDKLFLLAQQYAGDGKVNRLMVCPEKADQNFIFQTVGDRLETRFLAINPYTGELQAMLEGRRHFFSVIEEIHRQLLLGTIGKTITGVCCIMYLIILLTGVLIWWPKNRKMWKQRLKIKWDAKAKRLNWDIHAIGGIYAFPVVFIVVFTGLVWSYTWVNNGIYYLFDGKGPQKQAMIFNLPKQPKYPDVVERAYQQAQQLLNYRGEMRIYLPDKKKDVIEIRREQEEAAVPNIVDRLFFNRYTGDLVHQALYQDQTKGMKVRRLIFPIHTGSIGGWSTKIAYTILLLFAVSLPFTGFFIWLGKKQKKKYPTKQKLRAMPKPIHL